MNTRTVLPVTLILGICCLVVGSASAGDFVSQVIPSTTSPAPTINVPDGRVLHINAFTQTGGGTRGTISVSFDNGSTTTNVLGASQTDISTPDPVNHISIAGPAKVTINPSSAGKLFITYRKEAQPQ
jgi:hypothetical protein